MDDGVEAAGGEGAVEDRRVEDVALDEEAAGEAGEVRLLDAALVERVEVVEADHLVAAREEALGEVRADESSHSCDEEPHRGAASLAPPSPGPKPRGPRRAAGEA